MISFEGKTEKRSLMATAASMGLVIVILVFALFYIIFGHTLGWFASNDSVEADGMQVAAANNGYEFVVQRTTEYDSLLNGEPKYEDVALLKSTLAAAPYHYDLTAVSTAAASKLAYELQNDAPFRDDNEYWYFLMPGACGSMTFYIHPFSSEGVQANMELTLGCFGVVIDENDRRVVREVTSENVLNMLKGHIIFFTERRVDANDPTDTDKFKYNGLITDGTISYDTTQHTPTTMTLNGEQISVYEITLYWEWPLTYYDISEKTGNTAFADRYPPELLTYMNAHRNWFFAVNQNSNDPDDLSDGYNDGDQMIGENASYFAAFISPIV
ncbi:MAG: hypothetical protein IKZ81_01375 [Clostridia bacterium]|nr:hypothetical protein [Clostridia bacterium]